MYCFLHDAAEPAGDVLRASTETVSTIALFGAKLTQFNFPLQKVRVVGFF